MKKLLATISVFFFSVITCFAYSDRSSEAVTALSEEGILGGYSDGTFRPDAKINRAEFMKVAVAASGNSAAGSDCFSDVTDEWFAKYVCYAKTVGWVKGYSDSTFKPTQEITLIEALKILASALKVDLAEPTGKEWYSAPLETLAAMNAIPDTLHYYAEALSRGETAELVWRITDKKTDQPATTFAEFKGPICMEFEAETYDNIDMDRVRSTWLSWYNTARADKGLPAYIYNEQLDRTAFIGLITVEPWIY